MKINKKLENAFDILDSINETKEELQELNVLLKKSSKTFDQ